MWNRRDLNANSFLESIGFAVALKTLALDRRDSSKSLPLETQQAGSPRTTIDFIVHPLQIQLSSQSISSFYDAILQFPEIANVG
jgi:hypothetical protein